MNPEGRRYQIPTIFDFRRNLDAIVHSAEREARTVNPKTQSELAASGLAQSGPAIKAVIENVNQIHAETVDRCMYLIGEFIEGRSGLSTATLTSATRPRLESLAVMLLTDVPDAGAQEVAQQARTQAAAMFQQRLDGALQDIEIGFINGLKIKAIQERENEEVLEDMLEDRVTLVKKDGTVEREDVPALVTKGKIQIHNVSLPIEVDDHILRKLPNGLVEDYVVDDPVLHAGLGHQIFIVHVRRSRAPTAHEKVAIQNITNNFHGSHSRVNIGSTDNSTNVSDEIDMNKLQNLLDQIKPVISGLPVSQQQTIAAPLATLESEARSLSPSKSKVAAALQSIKTIAEGATGNLVAIGIEGLVRLYLS